MQEKLLYNLIEDLAGEGNGRIIETLLNKKNVNEFLIAKKMELTVNQVRNILYKLSNFGLVSFTRKKDQKKGWYIYYWTLDNKKSLKLIETHLKNKVKKLSEQLHNRETQRYYICPYCKIEVTEDIALENGFSCEECAEVYLLSDNAPHVREIKSKITRTQNEIVEIEQELNLLREKENRRRLREARKLEKLKEEEKEKKKIESRKKAAEKKKEAEKTKEAQKNIPAAKKTTTVKKAPAKTKIDTKKTDTKVKATKTKKTTTVKKAPVKTKTDAKKKIENKSVSKPVKKTDTVSKKSASLKKAKVKKKI